MRPTCCRFFWGLQSFCAGTSGWASGAPGWLPFRRTDANDDREAIVGAASEDLFLLHRAPILRLVQRRLYGDGDYYLFAGLYRADPPQRDKNTSDLMGPARNGGPEAAADRPRGAPFCRPVWNDARLFAADREPRLRRRPGSRSSGMAVSDARRTRGAARRRHRRDRVQPGRFPDGSGL